MASRSAFRIAGVLSTGGAEDDRVFLELGSLQRLAGLEGKVSLVELNLPGERAEIERGVQGLVRSLPGVDVRPVHQIVESQGRVLATIRWLAISLTALILVIIGLCVMATMTAIVLERRKDIAVMKALGASDRLVMRLFLSEGAGLGLVGGMAGFALGALLARELARRLFDVSLGLSWWTLPVVVLMSVLLAGASTLFPVRIVRGVEPAVVLKGE
jgi:putative ABC transport system permease protein